MVFPKRVTRVIWYWILAHRGTPYLYRGVTGIHGLISNGKTFYILSLLLFYFPKGIDKKGSEFETPTNATKLLRLLSSCVPLDQQRTRGLSAATWPTYGSQGRIRGNERRVGRE